MDISSDQIAELKAFLEVEEIRHGNEIKALRLRVKELENALQDAIECVSDWGSYASDYFKEKWDFDGDLARLKAVL